MAEKRVGSITAWTDVAPGLSVFRLAPQPATAFPDYKAGQYIALTRNGCRLTARTASADGSIRYEPTPNPDGSPKIGPVTHSYSIASAPFETKQSGELEIYVTLEKLSGGGFGRFTGSLFNASPHVGDTLGYVDRIVGNFTLDHRAVGAEHVVMVGTGTGLAPFVGMIKQAAHDARSGRPDAVKYTVIHANRTVGELGYDSTMMAVAEETIPGFDFEYVRSVSRPTPADGKDPLLGQGRANNLFRSILGLPTREEELVEEVRAKGGDVAATQQAAEKATKPRLGSGIDGAALRARMPEGRTTVLTCGNGEGMADIERICAKAGFKFEMEEW